MVRVTQCHNVRRTRPTTVGSEDGERSYEAENVLRLQQPEKPRKGILPRDSRKEYFSANT
jgi:hypothetical protein